MFFSVGLAANQPSYQRSLERSSQPLTKFALPSTSGAKKIPPKSLPISNTGTQLNQGHREIQSENVQSTVQSNVSAQKKAQDGSLSMGKYLL